MKTIIRLLALPIILTLASCDGLSGLGQRNSEGFGVPGTGTDGGEPVRLGLTGKVTLLPPKVCIGIGVKD